MLRVLFAVALLGAVAYWLPWSDRIVFTQDGVALQAPGEIVGDWRSESVRFQVDAAAELEPAWPADVREAAKAGRAVELVRDAAAEQEPKGKRFLAWRPGMLRIFRELEPSGLVLAMAMFFCAAVTSITRWWRLLAVAGCPTTWWNAFRLTFLGFFFNLVVPGLTGGDVIKAVLVVREHAKRRADALMSVIVDRGLGLLVLVALAVFAVWISGERFHELKLWVTLFFGAALLGLFLVLHPFPRRVLRIERLIARLPQRERIQSLDRALRLYGEHPFEMFVATLLSVGNHACIAGGVYALGQAFGETQLTVLEYVAVVALANVISSLPLAPGGWGLGEATFGTLFHVLGASTTLGIAVSLTYRLLVTAMNLSGGIFLLLPGGRNLRAEGEELAARDEVSDASD
ncbi:MAG: flippase-like domain-containing protein [Planctomycetes bacterium]|nr:flippase-like domain-containing protein [Planctomycetota bacterium]